MARQPKNPFHPGEILLEEFLEPKGATQAAFAERIGWTKTRLNELIKGKRGVTAAAALDLADALGTSPKLWMNLQATYDLDKAARVRRVESPRVCRRLHYLRRWSKHPLGYPHPSSHLAIRYGSG
jgi:addiction module HigA family antidote